MEPSVFEVYCTATVQVLGAMRAAYSTTEASPLRRSAHVFTDAEARALTGLPAWHTILLSIGLWRREGSQDEPRVVFVHPATDEADAAGPFGLFDAAHHAASVLTGHDSYPTGNWSFDVPHALTAHDIPIYELLMRRSWHLERDGRQTGSVKSGLKYSVLMQCHGSLTCDTCGNGGGRELTVQYAKKKRSKEEEKEVLRRVAAPAGAPEPPPVPPSLMRAKHEVCVQENCNGTMRNREYCPCTMAFATIEVEGAPSVLRVSHFGEHQHQRTRTGSASKLQRRLLDLLMSNNEGTGPTKLVCGVKVLLVHAETGRTIKNTGEISSSYMRLCVVQRARTEFLRKRTAIVSGGRSAPDVLQSWNDAHAEMERLPPDERGMFDKVHVKQAGRHTPTQPNMLLGLTSMKLVADFLSGNTVSADGTHNMVGNVLDVFSFSTYVTTARMALPATVLLLSNRTRESYAAAFGIFFELAGLPYSINRNAAMEPATFSEIKENCVGIVRAMKDELTESLESGNPPPQRRLYRGVTLDHNNEQLEGWELAWVRFVNGSSFIEWEEIHPPLCDADGYVIQRDESDMARAQHLQRQGALAYTFIRTCLFHWNERVNKVMGRIPLLAPLRERIKDMARASNAEIAATYAAMCKAVAGNIQAEEMLHNFLDWWINSRHPFHILNVNMAAGERPTTPDEIIRASNDRTNNQAEIMQRFLRGLFPKNARMVTPVIFFRGVSVGITQRYDAAVNPRQFNVTLSSGSTKGKRTTDGNKDPFYDTSGSRAHQEATKRRRTAERVTASKSAAAMISSTFKEMMRATNPRTIVRAILQDARKALEKIAKTLNAAAVCEKLVGFVSGLEALGGPGKPDGFRSVLNDAGSAILSLGIKGMGKGSQSVHFMGALERVYSSVGTRDDLGIIALRTSGWLRILEWASDALQFVIRSRTAFGAQTDETSADEAGEDGEDGEAEEAAAAAAADEATTPPKDGAASMPWTRPDPQEPAVRHLQWAHSSCAIDAAWAAIAYIYPAKLYDHMAADIGDDINTPSGDDRVREMIVRKAAAASTDVLEHETGWRPHNAIVAASAFVKDGFKRNFIVQMPLMPLGSELHQAISGSFEELLLALPSASKEAKLADTQAYFPYAASRSSPQPHMVALSLEGLPQPTSGSWSTTREQVQFCGNNYMLYAVAIHEGETATTDSPAGPGHFVTDVWMDPCYLPVGVPTRGDVREGWYHCGVIKDKGWSRLHSTSPARVWEVTRANQVVMAFYMLL